ncbi:MAG: flagellar biosynthesis protein FlhF [Phycisphaerales bacterium]
MPLKVYRARTMSEALAEVKKDLGAEAVILHTRSFKTSGLLGLGSKNMVEITATDDEPTAAKRPERIARRTAEHSTTPATRSLTSAAASKAYGKPAAPVAIAQSTSATSKFDPGFTQESESAVALMEPPSTPIRPAGDFSQPAMGVMNVAPSRQDKPAQDGSLEDELHSIKRMIGRILSNSASPASAPGSMPDALFEHYLALTEQSVATEIADEIVGKVRDELSAAELADAEIVRETMLRQIAKLVPAAGDSPLPRRPADGRPLTIALIGPTGVGKTTTLAKLAAVAKLRHGRTVGLVTTDTYRIAAVEQLRTYADIIGLTLKVVSSPAEMRPSLEELSDCDVILIDTAGRSQHDGDRLCELRTYLDEADPHETHLVLSTTSAEAVMLRAAERFAELRPNRLILTKLDEAVNFGVLLSVTRKAEVKLSYVTTGQEVPDHIEAGRPDRISRLILSGPDA